MAGTFSTKRTFIALLAAMVATLVGAIYWSGMAQPQRAVHGVFAGFEPKAGQDAQLLAAIRAAKTRLNGTTGVLQSSVYQLVEGDKSAGATKYLLITTFENMSYVKSATKNQALLSVNTTLSNLSEYSRILIVNLHSGKVTDQELQ